MDCAGWENDSQDPAARLKDAHSLWQELRPELKYKDMRLPYLKAQSVRGPLLAFGLSFFMMQSLSASPGRLATHKLVLERLWTGRQTTDRLVTDRLATDSIPRQVGDITFDPALDDPDFKVSDSGWVFQYYNSSSYYLHHKREIVRYFMSHYQPGADTVGQTGYCTVRFIINRAGQTGWFRCYQLDTTYQPFLFRREMMGQLVGLIRQWKEWQPLKYKDKSYDTYQYITFTLKNGRIVCITP